MCDIGYWCNILAISRLQSPFSAQPHTGSFPGKLNSLIVSGDIDTATGLTETNRQVDKVPGKHRIMHQEGRIVHLFKCIMHMILCKSEKSYLSIISGPKGLLGSGQVLNGDILVVRPGSYIPWMGNTFFRI